MLNATQMGTALASDYNVQTGKEANQDKCKACPITCHEGTQGSASVAPLFLYPRH